MTVRGEDERATLLTSVQQHMERTGMSATRFGYAAAGDPQFVRKLAGSHDFRTSTLDRVRAFLKRSTSKGQEE